MKSVNDKILRKNVPVEKNHYVQNELLAIVFKNVCHYNRAFIEPSVNIKRKIFSIRNHDLSITESE